MMTGTDVLPNLLSFTMQTAVIAAAATGVLWIVRIGSPGARYACWRCVLAGCLVLPWLLPSTNTPAITVVSDASADVGLAEPAAGSGLVTLLAGGPAPADAAIPWGMVVAVILAAGGLLRGAWLAAGLLRLSMLRRRSMPVDRDAEFDDVQRTLGTRAQIRCVDRLVQPATFGILSPVVLLPESVMNSPAGIRRAVVTHELFHVQRRDWLWVLMEELLRCVLWFHPAIHWLTSCVQLAREEVVDELTVLATGNRKAYIEALLTFVDGGRVQPAPAFARRRQLFTRILRLSKEPAMSSTRIVASTTSVIAAVVAAAWTASAMFPIAAAAPVPPAVPTMLSETAPPAGDSQPRINLPSPRAAAPAAQGARTGGAARPGPAAVPAPAAPQTRPVTPENPIPRRLSSVAVPYPAQLAGSGYRATLLTRVTLDASGSVADVQLLTVNVSGGTPADARVRDAGELFFAAARDAIRQWRYQSPADPPIAFFVQARFETEGEANVVQGDAPMSMPQRVVFPLGQANLDEVRALEQRIQELMRQRAAVASQQDNTRPDLVELETQIANIERELERARVLQQSAQALRGAAGGGTRSGGPPVAGLPVTPSPNQAASRPPLVSPSGVAPLRVGGNIRPPARMNQVEPVYPEVAKSARVQGVVILEALIDEQGHVADARILRSIPLLDQAALDAVRQWAFTPTLLNGSPVPIVMTVTVQFTLPPQ